MSDPAISVILPIYNGEKYMRTAIDSVLTQTLVNFELIIWNDGSNDKSMEIMSLYKDPRIQIYKNKKNLGLFPTINMAINKARADLIRLWSWDDIMKSNCLEAEKAFHDKYPQIGMSYCGRDIIDEEGKIVSLAPQDSTPEFISQKLAVQLLFYFGSIAGNISTVVLKKKIFNIVKPFREDMILSGDYDMWVRIAAQYPLGYVHEPLIYLRRHEGQFSRIKSATAIYICEDGEIRRMLVKMLPEQLQKRSRQLGRRFWNIRYVNYFVRSLLERDFKNASLIWREMRKMDNVFILIIFWVVTGNGRFLKRSPEFVA